MGVTSEQFSKGEDVFIYFDFEEVMFRWVSKDGTVYRKFKNEPEEEVPHTNELFMQARMGGVEITKEAYEAF